MMDSIVEHSNNIFNNNSYLDHTAFILSVSIFDIYKGGTI